MSPRVLLVAPSPPPYGGMALQARLLEKLLKNDGVSVGFFSSNFSLPSRINSLPGVRTCARFLMVWWKLWFAAREVDVIHVFAASWWYFFLTVWPAVVVGRLLGKRVVLNYRGGEAAVFFQQYQWLVRPVFRLADSVTVPSRFLAEIIGTHFAVPVVIVPNILDLSVFRYRERTRFQPNLVVTRHLEKMYDIESVLRAFQVVQERYLEASLWIVGSGNEEARLRSLSVELALRGVRFLGHVAQADLPAIFEERDILINASRVDNFPGALLEASASGMAVVTTAAGGIPFIYQDGKDAVLVEPGDWRGLGLAVLKVLDQPSLALNLTREAALLARSCEWKTVRKHLYAAYGRPFQEQAQGEELKCTVG